MVLPCRSVTSLLTSMAPRCTEKMPPVRIPKSARPSKTSIRVKPPRAIAAKPWSRPRGPRRSGDERRLLRGPLIQLGGPGRSGSCGRASRLGLVKLGVAVGVRDHLALGAKIVVLGTHDDVKHVLEHLAVGIF